MKVRSIVTAAGMLLLASCHSPPREARVQPGKPTQPGAATLPLAQTPPGDSTSAGVEGGAVEAATSADLIAILERPKATAEEKVAACQSLELMGPAAAVAIKPLISLLAKDGAVQLHAKRALVAIGPAAAPALRESMIDKAQRERDVMIDICAQIDFDANVPVADLERRRDTDSSEEKEIAGSAIRKMNEWHSALAALPASAWKKDAPLVLHNALYGHADVQVAALEALQRQGSGAEYLAALIRPLLESPTIEVARAAGDALGYMGPLAMPVLAEALGSVDDGERARAATALRNPTPEMLDSPYRDAVVAALGASLDDKSPVVVERAAWALSTYGLEAHPALVKAIKAGNAIVKKEVIEELLSRPEGFTRNYVKTIDPYTTAEAPAIEKTEIELANLVAPDLVKKARDETYNPALTALTNLPPAAVSNDIIDIVELWLAQSDPPIHIMRATTVLADLGLVAIPRLVEISGDKHHAAREVAFMALASMMDSNPSAAKSPQAHDPRVIEIMTEALSDPVHSIRTMAFRWVSKLDSPPPAIISHVRDFLAISEKSSKDGWALWEDERLRVSAVEILGRYPSDPRAVTELTHALSDTPRVRAAAILSLRSYGDKAEPAIAPLLQIVNTGPEVESEQAAATMLLCGKAGRRAIAGWYLRRLTSGTGSRSGITVEAIAAIGPDAADAVPALRAQLKSQDNDFRILVANALAQIGPAASPAIPDLSRMADNSEMEIRRAACSALVKISPDGKGLGPALLAAVYNGDRSAAGRIAATFRLTADTGLVVKRLRDLAENDTDPAVRATATQAVAQLSGD